MTDERDVTPAAIEMFGGDDAFSTAFQAVNREALYRVAECAQACIMRLNDTCKDIPEREQPKFITNEMGRFGAGIPVRMETVCGVVQNAINEYTRTLDRDFRFADESADSLDDFRFVYEEMMSDLRSMHYEMMQFSSLLDKDLLTDYLQSASMVKQQALDLTQTMDKLEPYYGFKRTGSYLLDYWRGAAAPAATLPMTDNPRDWGIAPDALKQDGPVR